MKTKDVYSAAIKKYGKISQLIMCMEEMSELIKELSKKQPEETFHFNIVDLEIFISDRFNLNRSPALDLLFNELHIFAGILNALSPDS